MKHKPVSSKMMGIEKASKKMGKGMSGVMPMPKMGKGNMSNAPMRHVMNKMKK